ncbi:hypothetical protein ES702_03194 [subsurface metagenome]
MPAIEALLTEQQKKNLEQARRMLGLRSRAALFRAVADHAVEVAARLAEVMPAPADQGPLSTIEKLR